MTFEWKKQCVVKIGIWKLKSTTGQPKNIYNMQRNRKFKTSDTMYGKRNTPIHNGKDTQLKTTEKLCYGKIKIEEFRKMRTTL
jgi:hypothetical protein